MALAPPVALQKGYGVLEKGTAMAKNGSSDGNGGRYVPYDPSTVTGKETAPARAYLLQDSGEGATSLFVGKDDSYKFSVGDEVYINDDTTAAETLDAISAIDRDTYTHMAEVSVTAVSGETMSDFKTSRFAYIAVKGADTCAGILPVARDTGTGANAKTSEGQLLISNAMLYTGSLVNYDDDAETDMGSSEHGQLTIFK
jgi:hypothetical protein